MSLNLHIYTLWHQFIESQQMSYHGSSYRPKSNDHYYSRDRNRQHQGYQSYDSSRGGSGGGASNANYNRYQSQDHRHHNRPTSSKPVARTPYRLGSQYKPSQSPSSFQSRQNVYNQYGSRYSTHSQFQLWMGDLDPTWTEETIEQIWTTLVEKPTSVKIIRDRFNPNKPAYCFVSFKDQNAVDLAVQRHGQQVPGSTRVFKLNHAGSTGASGSTTGGGHQPRSGAMSSTAGVGANDYSMFVGDISPEVSEVLLYDKFNSMFPNQIKLARVIMDLNTGKSKGFGFVRFFSSDAFNRALTEMNGVTIGSKQIRVGVASSSTGDATQSGSTSTQRLDYRRIQVPQPQPEFNQFTDPNNTCLTIHGLSSKVTEIELEQHFIAFGDLIYCQISDDFKTGYIKYYLRSSAEAALLWLHGQMINDCRVKISWGKSVTVEDHAVKYIPNTERGSQYEKSNKVPLIYFNNANCHNKRLDKLSKEEILDFSHRPDGSEIMTTSSINQLYLQSKENREKDFADSIY